MSSAPESGAEAGDPSAGPKLWKPRVGLGWSLRRGLAQGSPYIEAGFGELVRYEIEGFTATFPRGLLRLPKSINSTYLAYSHDRIVVGSPGGFTQADFALLWHAEVLPQGQLWLVFSNPLLTSLVWQATPAQVASLPDFAARLVAQRDAHRDTLPEALRQESANWTVQLRRDGSGWQPTIESLGEPSVAIPRVGGVDHDTWQKLCLAVSAAHRGDRLAAHTCVHSWATDSIETFVVAGVYLYPALAGQLWNLYGRWPTLSELQQLSAKAQPRLVQLLSTETALEDVFRESLNLPLTTEPKPERWAFDAIAALGAILRDPQRDLPTLGPDVAHWVSKHQGEVVEAKADARSEETRQAFAAASAKRRSAD